VIVGIYGSDGFAREVLPIVRMQYDECDEVFFVDDNANLVGQKRNSIEIISFERAVELSCKMTIAIADPVLRKSLAEKCTANGLSFINVIHPNVEIYDEVIFGVGIIATANVTFTSNITIGDHFHANIYSYVAHDCVIGDYVTFAPRVCCNGRVHVEDLAYVGTAAVLRQGSHEKPLVIGASAIVGMGAVVTKNVAPDTTVVGNPAKPFPAKSSN